MPSKGQHEPSIEVVMTTGAKANAAWRRFIRMMLDPLPATATAERSPEEAAS